MGVRRGESGASEKKPSALLLAPTPPRLRELVESALLPPGSWTGPSVSDSRPSQGWLADRTEEIERPPDDARVLLRLHGSGNGLEPTVRMIHT